MLFALVGFRNTAPGVPPFGSLFDFTAFFWAELAVAGSLTAVILRYHCDAIEPSTKRPSDSTRHARVNPPRRHPT